MTDYYSTVHRNGKLQFTMYNSSKRAMFFHQDQAQKKKKSGSWACILWSNQELKLDNQGVKISRLLLNEKLDDGLSY